MNAYCLNIGDTYTLDYTLTAQYGAINDVEIVVTPSAALSLVDVTSTSGTGSLVGDTFSIPTIAANTQEVVTITVAIENVVLEDLTVEINATTTTPQLTTIDDTKVKDLEDIYTFHRRCLENNLARYEIPNTEFADVENPMEEEVRAWVDVNLSLPNQKINAELWMVEIPQQVTINPGYYSAGAYYWDFVVTDSNNIDGWVINGTPYTHTSFAYTLPGGFIVLNEAGFIASLQADLLTEGYPDVSITVGGTNSFLELEYQVNGTANGLNLSLELILSKGSEDTNDQANFIQDIPTINERGSTEQYPDHIWKLTNDSIQTIFKRENNHDTFYVDSSITAFQDYFAQKGNPQRPFKSHNDILNRADFNAGDTIVFLKADGTDFTTTKDVVVTAPISSDISKLFYVQDNHELTLRSNSDFGVYAWGIRVDGDNTKVIADLNKVDSSLFNIGPGVDTSVNIRFNECIITGTGFGNGVFYIGNGTTTPPTPHISRSNILIEGDYVSTVNMGSLTEREDTDFTYKIKRLTNSGPTIGPSGALQLYRTARRCNYTIKIDEFILNNYNFTSLAAFALSTGASGDTFTLIDSNLTFDFGRVSIDTTSSFALTDYRTSMINAQASGWNIQNSTITIKIAQLEKSDVHILGLSGATFTDSTLILDVNGKSDGALAIFENCTFTNSKVIVKSDFETSHYRVIDFQGTSSPTLVIEDSRLKCTDAPIIAAGDIEIYKSRLINTVLGTTVNRNAVGASTILAEGVIANGASDGNYSVVGSPFIINAAVS